MHLFRFFLRTVLLCLCVCALTCVCLYVVFNFIVCVLIRVHLLLFRELTVNTQCPSFLQNVSDMWRRAESTRRTFIFESTILILILRTKRISHCPQLNRMDDVSVLYSTVFIDSIIDWSLVYVNICLGLNSALLGALSSMDVELSISFTLDWILLH